MDVFLILSAPFCPRSSHKKLLSPSMSFEPLGNSIVHALQKYNLGKQAKASYMCRRVEKVVGEHFPDFVALWAVQKFEEGIVYFKVSDSAASSALFMRTHDLLELLEQADIRGIKDICIVRR